MIKKIYQFIFFTCMGWRIEGEIPALKKYVIIVAPHTSNFDFVIGVFARRIIGFNARYVAKKELFVFPFGYFFRWMGGYPVDRLKNLNFVEMLSEIFKKEENFILTMTPEATRSRNDEWKTGFYYVAKAAEVPIVKVAFDYGQKRVVIDPPFDPDMPVETCIRDCKKYFSKFRGKNPAKGVVWKE